MKDTGCVSCGKNIHPLTKPSESTNQLIKIVSLLLHKVDVHYSLEIPSLLLIMVVVLWLFLISFRAGR